MPSRQYMCIMAVKGYALVNTLTTVSSGMDVTRPITVASVERTNFMKDISGL